ncbi:hypothetical protein HHK36_011449 [Tetracentron sinense]|uniref:Uncharacterized protein n=1 Tax=Tetracentron sinense TaxID=13715 RepID=A0A834ZB55_TETSI|nr:hypothetical protein HHK36_011449 [Tetracentron sinense]
MFGSFLLVLFACSIAFVEVHMGGLYDISHSEGMNRYESSPSGELCPAACDLYAPAFIKAAFELIPVIVMMICMLGVFRPVKSKDDKGFDLLKCRKKG